jgi:hypothetical protein
MVPVVLAVFANDQKQSLSLREEKKELQKIFDDPAKVELKIIENADFDDINENIIRENLQERIIVFHYGGHSDGKNIRLIDGNTTAEGLAKLFKSLPRLQLIFLNGCDSYEQSEAIQKEEVKSAVLTTLKPLNDTIAVSFASYFYFAFYHLNSLNTSFLSAEARIVGNPNFGKHHFAKLPRGIELDAANINRNLEQNKTVYVLTEPEKDYLARTLLFNINYTKPLPKEYSYLPNRRLIESLSNSVRNGKYITEAFRKSKAYYDFEESLTSFEKAKNNRNFNVLVLDILPLLPFPLSFHLGNLSQKAADWANLDDDRRIEFLKCQVITYHSLVQLLGLTLLSSFWYELAKTRERELEAIVNPANGDAVQLASFKEIKIRTSEWNALRNIVRSASSNDTNGTTPMAILNAIYDANKLEPGNLLITDGQWDVIKGFMNASQANNQDINYPSLIITIREIFDTNNIDPFIKEYRDLRNIYETEEEFFNVHLHMQGLKASINNREVEKLNIGWLCFITEKMLCEILSNAGFLIRYKLTTVKDIEITKSRLSKPQYYIRHIVLDGQSVNDDDITEYPKYTDSRSMILARGIEPESFTDFMTLSPFIIDENAFRRANLSKPYFFSHSEGNSYVYRWSLDPDTVLVVNDATYVVDPQQENDPNIENNRRIKAIKDEMDEFKKLVNQIN